MVAVRLPGTRLSRRRSSLRDAASARRSKSAATPNGRTLLNRRVRPFLLRRTKDEVATELPPKTEIVEPVEMEASAARDLRGDPAGDARARCRQAIAEQGLARSGIIILDALLKMRQACCDPRLLKLKTGAQSARPVRPSSTG